MTKPRMSQGRSRAVIVLIALLSIVPFGLAWYYARHPELIAKTSNYGTLILPVRQADTDQLLARPVSRAEWLPEIKGRWVLLHVPAGPCAAACTESLHKTHQARLMLNKEVLRVRRLLLLPAGTPAAELDPILKQDEDLIVAGAPDSLRQTLTEALGKPPADDMVVLMDPLGNLVLWYGTGFDPYKLVKDLKHLLRASQIG
jgi:hypothetical protein